MIEKIRKIYLSKELFIVSSVLTVCCYLFDAIRSTAYGSFCDYAWIFLGLVVLLQWAFLSGQINVQKMLFGSMLLAMIKEQAEILQIDAAYAGSVVPLDVIELAFSVIIFVSHIYQQIDHKGKSLAPLVNQLLGFIGMIYLLSAITNITLYQQDFTNYIFIFGYVFNSIMVICMETRVEAYKQIRDKAREEGTWTEEKRKEAKKLFKLK